MRDHPPLLQLETQRRLLSFVDARLQAMLDDRLHAQGGGEAGGDDGHGRAGVEGRRDAQQPAGIDALANDIQVTVFGMLAATPKLPFDPGGIAILGGGVRASLSRFTASQAQPNALLRGDPGFAPVVILPDIADTSATDRGNRYLNGIRFTAYAQNAIQVVAISGTVNL